LRFLSSLVPTHSSAHHPRATPQQGLFLKFLKFLKFWEEMAMPAETLKASDAEPMVVDTTHVRAKNGEHRPSSGGSSGRAHGVPELVGGEEVRQSGRGKREWFAYLRTKQFWLVMGFGYVYVVVMINGVLYLTLGTGRSWLCALLARTLSLHSLQGLVPISLLFRLSLIMFFLMLSGPV
jgi:hypothetical protein